MKFKKIPSAATAHPPAQAEALRLSQIETRWSLLSRAHEGDADQRFRAQSELLLRYCGPAFYYLRAMVRDESATEELCQEFALRFLRGDFRHADPRRGRFRDYLKVALMHLAGEFARRRDRLPSGRVLDSLAAAEPSPAELHEKLFIDQWRSEVLNRTWESMKAASLANGDSYHELLQLKSSRPERTSDDLAAELGRRNGRTIRAESVRQTLRRARLRFAELLRQEVAATIESNDPAAVDSELADLGLLSFGVAQGAKPDE